MSEPFIGALILFGGNFAIRGYAMCNGQLLSIAQNTALFSILGTTYGGNGQTTFALPDLRGRVPIHWGQGPGMPNYSLGQVGGAETVTLLTSQLPAHNHPLNGSTVAGDVSVPTNALVAHSGALDKEYKAATTADTVMHSSAIGLTGGNQPIAIRDPYLAITYLIALEGIFPSRN